MKKLFVFLTMVGFGFAATNAALAAATVAGTYVNGGYKYTCIEGRTGYYCGNWNVVQ